MERIVVSSSGREIGACKRAMSVGEREGREREERNASQAEESKEGEENNELKWSHT